MREQIDVVMCTYNSNRPFFRKVLLRIRDEIPIHCFIVVDKFSSDGTIDEILGIFPKAKIILSNENLGIARKLGINMVDTRFFAFIDDDVLLLKGWYEHTKGLMTRKVGAVSCYAWARSRFLNGLYEDARLKDQIIVSSWKTMDFQRGFTYAALLRKEVVADWKPSKILSACEDHEILRHVVRKGFIWLTSYAIFAEHLGFPESFFPFLKYVWKKTMWNAAGCRYTKLVMMNSVQLFVRTAVNFWTGFKMTCLSKNPFIFPYYCIDGFAFFTGYMCWKKNLFLYR